MRWIVTAVRLACASCAIAQTPVVEPPPVQKPTVLTPGQRSRTKPGAPKSAGAANAKAVNVPPNTPVVTLQGVCHDRQAKTPCETVMTREDLDRYVGAFPQDASKTARGRQAVQYARTLAYSSLAEQQGLGKNPELAKELEEQLKLVRMRFLASAFLQNLQKQTITGVAEPEIQKYYNEHHEQYEKLQVSRLAVPVAAPAEGGRHLDLSAVKAEMVELRTRAVAGEDFDQLQQDAYKHLHIQATPPPAKVSMQRRSGFQGDEAKVFDLKPGEITAVLELPAAFAIVKLESKELVPIEAVRQEIEAALRAARMQNALNKATRLVKTQFNLQYLDMPVQPDIFGTAATGPAAIGASTRPASVDRP